MRIPSHKNKIKFQSSLEINIQKLKKTALINKKFINNNK